MKAPRLSTINVVYGNAIFVGKQKKKKKQEIKNDCVGNKNKNITYILTCIINGTIRVVPL